MNENVGQLSPTVEPKLPALKLKFLSHGTLESKDIDRTKRFYEDFLGLEVRRTSPVSLMVRLGGTHVYAVVLSKNKSVMPLLSHNGLDVDTKEDVEEAYGVVCQQADQWGLHRIGKPSLQHGTFSFYFWDMDDNSWEILTNPTGGYSWFFARGDLDGKGIIERSFQPPGHDHQEHGG